MGRDVPCGKAGSCLVENLSHSETHAGVSCPCLQLGVAPVPHCIPPLASYNKLQEQMMAFTDL